MKRLKRMKTVTKRPADPKPTWPQGRADESTRTQARAREDHHVVRGVLEYERHDDDNRAETAAALQQIEHQTGWDRETVLAEAVWTLLSNVQSYGELQPHACTTPAPYQQGQVYNAHLKGPLAAFYRARRRRKTS